MTPVPEKYVVSEVEGEKIIEHSCWGKISSTLCLDKADVDRLLFAAKDYAFFVQLDSDNSHVDDSYYPLSVDQARSRLLNLATTIFLKK
jgi:hypothetical protein